MGERTYFEAYNVGLGYTNSKFKKCLYQNHTHFLYLLFIATLGSNSQVGPPSGNICQCGVRKPFCLMALELKFKSLMVLKKKIKKKMEKNQQQDLASEFEN